MTTKEIKAYLKEGVELPLTVKDGKLAVFRPDYSERLNELIQIRKEKTAWTANMK